MHAAAERSRGGATAKVHPNAVAPEPAATTTTSRAPEEEPPPALLTVWRKSLLFNCDGFTVFRVDCYASARRRAEVVLMANLAGRVRWSLLTCSFGGDQ
ncbi:protein LURP-one-related 8-like [Panicum miliaceum]|uniref:Protein LURP-one-related 8-like n=1 Tax=Panicum miliaceum TaxID=4540 RepID=A0A3L6R6E7_PANMI|nr:protein LURP-one-related 8-like [Panicum miliaceum]